MSICVELSLNSTNTGSNLCVYECGIEGRNKGEKKIKEIEYVHTERRYALLTLQVHWLLPISYVPPPACLLYLPNRTSIAHVVELRLVSG